MTPDQHNQVAHLATYITDDGMIASHCGVTRADVSLVRSNMVAATPRRFQAVRSEGKLAAIKESAVRAETDAKMGSARLLKKMQRVIDEYAARYRIDPFTAAVELQNCKVR